MQGKRRLFIVGAGNFGRVLENWLSLIDPSHRDWELAGFLHHSQGKSPLEGFPSNLAIAGDWLDYRFDKSDLCVIGTSDPSWKRKVYDHLKGRVGFLTYIDPTVGMNPAFVEIGEGTVICRNSVLACNVKIGRMVTICMGSQIGHDVTLGDFTSLMASVDISGHVKVGESAFVGSKAVIIPHKKICSGARIGAGSVVISSITDMSRTYFGNPAVPLDIQELARKF